MPDDGWRRRRHVGMVSRRSHRPQEAIPRSAFSPSASDRCLTAFSGRPPPPTPRSGFCPRRTARGTPFAYWTTVPWMSRSSGLPGMDCRPATAPRRGGTGRCACRGSTPTRSPWSPSNDVSSGGRCRIRSRSDGPWTGICPRLSPMDAIGRVGTGCWGRTAGWRSTGIGRVSLHAPDTRCLIPHVQPSRGHRAANQ